jgi:hypothetical protein
LHRSYALTHPKAGGAIGYVEAFDFNREDKMKKIIGLLLLLASPAYALDLNDNMQMWKRSPNAVRIKLLTDPAIAGQVKGNNVGILECMNEVKDTKVLMEKTVQSTIEECAGKVRN